MADQIERIAVLEAEVETLKASQREILDCMHSIRDEMTRYKGFLGGVAFIASGVGIFLTIFRDWVLGHIK
jgi:hypothetical protein